jgi:hypothetical protein
MTLRRWIAGLIALSFLGLPAATFAQLEALDEPAAEAVEEVIEAVERVARPRRPPMATAPAFAPGAGPAEEAKSAEKEEPEVEPTRKPRAPLPPRHMVLRLLDGSTIAGELSVNEITVATEFGELTIPVAKIKSFTPGLDSNPKAIEELNAKLKDLESDDYKTREQAHKDLAAMGPKIAKQLSPYLASENAELKRHISEILKEFEQLAEEEGEDEEGEGTTVQVWINQDTIETTDFTVIGKISPATFEMASKYGPLTIALGDIVQASRPVDARESIRRSVSVPGQNLALRSFKSTGVRVQAGDRVTITASGNIVMSPWGSNASSGPDGMPNYGWYVPSSIPGGALVYRIGDKGQVSKAGTKVSFTAKSSGMLQLAIGMMPEYSNEGYNFPGEYKAKVKVDPQ